MPLPVLATLLQPAVTSLRVDFVGPSNVTTPREAEAFLSSIEEHASLVTKGNFQYIANLVGLQGITKPELRQRISKFLTSFSTLQTATVAQSDLPHVTLPGSLNNLILECYDYPDDMKGEMDEYGLTLGDLKEILNEYGTMTVDALETKHNVKEVEMQHILGSFGNWSAFKEVAQVCRKKGIKLVWTGPWDQALSEFAPFSVGAYFRVLILHSSH